MQSKESASWFHVNQFKLENMDDLLQLEDISFGSEAYPSSEFIRLLKCAKDTFLVAQAGQKIIGYIVAVKKWSNGHIVSLAVHPNYRRRGVGTTLINIVIDKLINKGVKSIALEVDVTNDSAIFLYLKHGFKVEGILPDYYSDNAPAFYMTLNLNRYAKEIFDKGIIKCLLRKRPNLGRFMNKKKEKRYDKKSFKLLEDEMD